MRQAILLLGVIAHFFIGASLQAKEYIVSPNDPDIREMSFVQPGDTVTLRKGIYRLKTPFSPTRSGEPGKWIVYRAMPGEEVVLDGDAILYLQGNEKKYPFSTLTHGIVHIEKVNYIRIVDIKVCNSRAAGFIVKGPDTKCIELINCSSDRSYNSGIGIWYSDSVRVEGCEVTRANDIDYRSVEVPRPGEAPHEAISICGAKYFTIAGNKVHHCYKEGIDCKEVSRHGKVCRNYVHDLPRQAYYVDAWFGLLEDIELENNTAHDCGWGFAISVEGKGSELRNIRFHHNLIYNMKGAGILFGAWGHNLLRSDIHIYNNTLYKCGSPQWFSGGVGSIDILSTNAKDVYIYRNICDKGWDYELGFSFTPAEVEQKLKEQNFIIAENLFESVKNRPSRRGQFDLLVTEYLPPRNRIGAPLYRNELGYDLVPEELPKVKEEDIQWKYKPSPWYGAFKPLKTIE